MPHTISICTVSKIPHSNSYSVYAWRNPFTEVETLASILIEPPYSRDQDTFQLAGFVGFFCIQNQEGHPFRAPYRAMVGHA